MSQDQDKHVAAGDDRKDAWRGQDKGFRGRENGQGQPSDDFDDDADLPSLNRKRGGNKLITAAGYVFMALLAVAAIVAKVRNKTEVVLEEELEIAMALAPEPKLLLLDEPTGGMSLEERRVTGELLAPIKSRCSLVIVEHDLDFIRDICDRLTVLDQGAVLDTGSIEQIQASPKVQEVYLRRA